jgi:hypothetical protein
MRVPGLLAVPCLVLFAFVASAAAQDTPTSAPVSPPATIEILPLSSDQERELDKWLAAMEKWQQYDAKWRNRPVHDGWSRIVPRQPPPPAPAWLDGHCAALAAARFLDLEPRTATACRVLDDPTVVSAARDARPASEQQERTSFLTRIHLDGGWMTTPTGSRMYGIVGSHVSLVDVGRLQLFGPPGIMLLTVPDESGGRRMALGYTWGISVRLADVRLASPTKNMTLFLNLSKVWLGTGETGGNSRGYDIVGFSIAPRKKR